MTSDQFEEHAHILRRAELRRDTLSATLSSLQKQIFDSTKLQLVVGTVDHCALVSFQDQLARAMICAVREELVTAEQRVQELSDISFNKLP